MLKCLIRNRRPRQSASDRPPKRFPARSKGRWQTLSAELREDIWAREIEFDTAFKRYDGLGMYATQAERNGRTLVEAMRSYSSLESEVRKDPIEGVGHLWQMLGLNPAEATAACVAKFAPDLGEHIFGQGFQEGRKAGVIQQFAADKPDFELLKPAMEAIAASAPELPINEVYSRARWSDPHARVIEMQKYQQPRPVARTPVEASRNAAKATVGAPSSGSSSSSTSRHAAGDENALDTVRRAVAAQQNRG